MKRVKHFTAIKDDVRVNLTMEIISNDPEGASPWSRADFLNIVENWSGRAMLGLHQLGFPLAKIKMK